MPQTGVNMVASGGSTPRATRKYVKMSERIMTCAQREDIELVRDEQQGGGGSTGTP